MTFGARRWFLSTKMVSFVDAEGKCCRLSTYRVPSVEVRCREGTFVHRRGHFCGRGEGIAAACPQIRPISWMKWAFVGATACDGASREPLCASREPPEPSRDPPEASVCLSGTLREPSGAFGRITTQIARLQGRGRTCRRCG